MGRLKNDNASRRIRHDSGHVVIQDIEVDYTHAEYPITLCVSLLG